jgi:hypothetical protein
MMQVVSKLRSAGIEPQPNDALLEQPVFQNRALIERVILRAHEIRKGWQDSSSDAVVRTRSFVQNGRNGSLESLFDDGSDRGGSLDDESEESSLFESNGSRLLSRDIDAEAIRAAIRANLPSSERIEREVLLRQCAQQLGFSRLSKKLRSRLNKTIGAEVRFGRIQVDSEWQYLWKQ